MPSKLAVLCGFCLIALFPAIQHVAKILPDAPLSENRNPVPTPVWTKLSLKDYLLGWQASFNDRYSGRNFLIRLKTQIDYSVFSYSDKVHIGPDNWLFYRSVIDRQEPRMESMNDAENDTLVANLRRLNDWLAGKGIRLIIVDNEMKDVFYPEQLPTALPRRSSPSRYSRLRERIASETGAEFVDTHAILFKLKTARPVFHRTDFHWNDPAAFAVSQAVVNRIAELAGPGYRGWRWPLEITTTSFSGGEASFLPLLKPVSESGLFVQKTWPDLPRAYRPDDGPYEYALVHTVDDPTLLPGLVVLGDSFFDGMVRSGFIEHFRSVHRARNATIHQTLAALPAGTRFFLLQFISPKAPALAAPWAPFPGEN